MKQEKEFDLSSVLLNDSLYSEYVLDEITNDNLLNLIFHHDSNNSLNKLSVLDSYCPTCKKETTFISRNTDLQLLTNILISTGMEPDIGETDNKFYSEIQKVGTFQRNFKCPREINGCSHDLVIVFKVQNNKLIKIGQYPSIADLLNFEIIKYKKLNQDIYQELNRAIGLASHGIGIGSFVYLRRIIEKYIVLPILDELVKNGLITENEIFESDFKRKILLAKNQIPEFLVNNSKIYSILSKGIHHLEENECNTYFPILRNSIEMILDEKIDLIEREKKANAIRTDLSKIN